MPKVPKIRFANRSFDLPRSRIARITIGVLLILGGVLGFLPILGFWMLPLGLLVLSFDIAPVRRARRRLAVAIAYRWRGRQRRPKSEPA